MKPYIKRHDRIIVVFMLTGLLLASLLSAAELSKPGEDVLSQVDTILKKVETIRGLKFKEKPKIVVLSRAKARAIFKPGKPDIERMKLEEDVYKMSLLLPPDYPYIHEKTEQDIGWIAATVGDTIYIIRENFLSDTATARRVISHESVHVLQRQWFNAPYGGPTLDSTKAIQAAIEGDADLVADLYCNQSGIPIHKIEDLYTRDPVTALGIFPYVFGDRFVAYLYRTGGWELVNRMYARLPNTTKVIMFPELYIKNWTPTDIRREVEGPQSNTSVEYSSRMGAYYVFLIYWGHGKSREDAMELAKNWEGDWLVMGDSKEGNITLRHLTWAVLFTNNETARNFSDFLRRLSENNTYANFTVEVHGKEVILKAWKIHTEDESYEERPDLSDMWENLR